MSFYLEKAEQNDFWLGKFSLLENTGKVIHSFTARFGGVSKKPYDSLNMAMHVGDETDDVFENRSRLAAALKVNVEKICSAEQVHGENIYRVTAEDAGRGVHSYSSAIAETDALITNVRGLPLMMCFADCVPIMIFDPDNGVVGIAHGGWKGTVKHITQKTLQRMKQEFGTSPEECLAVIGPSIGPCCFLVGDDVAEEFRKSFPEEKNEIVFSHSDGWHVDLWEANRRQLLAEGVKKQNIEMAETCTACNSSVFYSYRADNGVTGRMAAIIALK